MSFVIENAQDGLPTYFAPKAGRNLAAGSGWIADRDEALQFARERDAQAFLDVYLPGFAPFCTITRYERPA